jgi:hypothetical protein
MLSQQLEPESSGASSSWTMLRWIRSIASSGRCERLGRNRARRAQAQGPESAGHASPQRGGEAGPGRTGSAGPVTSAPRLRRPRRGRAALLSLTSFLQSDLLRRSTSGRHLACTRPM